MKIIEDRITRSKTAAYTQFFMTGTGDCLISEI